MTQADRIFNHLKKFGSITNKDANEKYGIRHLPKIIMNIKKKEKEVTITCEIAKGINRFNEKTWWKIYKIGNPQTACT